MPEKLVDILENLGRPRVLVVGDMILDRYAWGDVDRISPEAPIQVLNVMREETKLGGAASVVNNLHALEVAVTACGIIGDDAPGETFREMLTERGLDASGILMDPTRRTSLKTRMIARKQQVLRVDREDTAPFSDEMMTEVTTFIRERAADSDIIIISDYGKGLITADLVAEIVEIARKTGIRAIADTLKQSDFSRYTGLSAITPNRGESEQATGFAIASAVDAEAAARKLIEDLELEAVVMTLDREGIVVLERDGEFHHLPTRPQAVYDVTGAGDMVISVLGAALAAGNGYVEAARLANVAGGLEVRRIGVQPLSREDIITGIRHEHAIAADKMKTVKELLPILEEHRRRGERVVFTNGCFDILHLGHARYLQFARRQGDLLVVGVNSDKSVRKLKGPNRPVCAEGERAQMLAALGDVDYVVIFEEDTPDALIREVRPDVLVKGEDWKDKGIVGSDFVESYGGEVVLAPLVRGVSTSDIIQRILKSAETSGRKDDEDKDGT